MYNGLAFVAICLADELLCEKLGYIEIDSKKDMHFIDVEAGYAFYRGYHELKERYFACSLRRHVNSSTNAASAFYIYYEDRPIPIAGGYINSEAPLVEGVICKESTGRTLNLDFQRNVEIEKIDKGFSFSWENDDFLVKKKIMLHDSYIEWDYDCFIKKGALMVKHVLPLVIHDGKEEMKFYKKSSETINLQKGEFLYQISSNHAKNIDIMLKRDYTSPFGVVSNVEVDVKPNDEEGKRYIWSTFLFLNNREKENLCCLTGPEVKITQANAVKDGDCIYCSACAEGQDITYGWELFCNGELVMKTADAKDGNLTYHCKKDSGYYLAKLVVAGAHQYSIGVDVPVCAIDDSLIPCNKEQCTACMACANICPYDAIVEEYDNNGFRYPQIMKGLCMNCGLCKTVCPSLNSFLLNNLKNKHCYTVYDKDDENISCNVFSLFAEHVLQKKGVIYGAYFDTDSVIRIGSSISQSMDSFMYEPYVESDIGLIYRKVKKDLVDGKMVLYSGAPCQIAALRMYLGKEYNNLYTIDFICRGFGGSGIFASYKSALRKAEGKPLIGYTFRNLKDKACLKVSFPQRSYYINPKSDEFNRLLKNGDILRENCFSCPYSKENHYSDIIFNSDFGKVTSIVPNTKKGKRWLKILIGKYPHIKVAAHKVAVNSECLWKIKKKPLLREEMLLKLRTEMSDYFQDKISLSKIYSQSVTVDYDKEEKTLHVVANVEVVDDSYVEYAWYVYRDNKILEKIWYKSESVLNYPIVKEGIYKVLLFIRDDLGRKTTVMTQEYFIKDA